MDACPCFSNCAIMFGCNCLLQALVTGNPTKKKKTLETRTQEKPPENIANNVVDQISGWRPILGTAQELLVLGDICALTCKRNSRTIEALHVECRGCVNLSTCIMLCPAIASDCTCIPPPVGHPWATRGPPYNDNSIVGILRLCHMSRW